VPIIVLPSPLTVPVKLKLCGPACTLKVTFCPSKLPLTGADPLQGNDPGCCPAGVMEYVKAPVTEPLSWSKNPLRSNGQGPVPDVPQFVCETLAVPPNEASDGGVIVNCQLPASAAPA